MLHVLLHLSLKLRCVDREQIIVVRAVNAHVSLRKHVVVSEVLAQPRVGGVEDAPKFNTLIQILLLHPTISKTRGLCVQVVRGLEAKAEHSS